MSRRATPKQIAYLGYMGIDGARELSFAAASARIEALGDEMVDDPELAERRDRWRHERMRLHPELYAAEAAEWIVDARGAAYRSYVRSRHVGCSARLTRDVMLDVVAAELAAAEALWRGEEVPAPAFYRRLCAMHPACVDGAAPAERPPKAEDGEGPQLPLPPIRRTPARLVRPGRRRRKGPDWTEVAGWTVVGIAGFGVILLILWILI